MSDIKLLAPRVRVLLEQPHSDDFLDYSVQTDNRDIVRWDLIRSRKKWPAMDEAPMLFQTVIAWHALKRSGEIGDETVESFLDRCIEVMPLDEDGKPLTADDPTAATDAATVDPTQPVPDTGY